jgi:hypothetical protein
MSSNLATGIIGLTGVVVGGGITAGTQRYAARLARLRVADDERQRYAAARVRRCAELLTRPGTSARPGQLCA